MATAVGRNCELNCPICLEKFNFPKRLPCLHTFCEPCIQSYVQVQKSVTEEETSASRFFMCPLCRFKTELPDISVTEWTQSKLPTDHLIASLLGHKTIDSKLEEVYCEPCTFANEKNLAKYHCRDCKEFFCEQCFNYLHKRKRDNNLHIATIITPDSDLKLLEMEEPCPLHTNKVLEAFCFDHRKLCCSFCFMTEHKKCDIVKSLDEIAKDERESLDMDIFVKSISKTESQTLSSLQKANEKLAQFSDDKDSMLQSLTDILETTKTHLNTLHRELKGSIEKLFANSEECQQFEVECIASFQKMLMYNKKLAEAVGKHGSRKQKFVTMEKTRIAIQKDYEKLQLVFGSSETSKCYVLDIDEELKSIQKWSKLGSVKSKQQCDDPLKGVKESLCDLGCFKDYTIFRHCFPVKFVSFPQCSPSFIIANSQSKWRIKCQKQNCKLGIFLECLSDESPDWSYEISAEFCLVNQADQEKDIVKKIKHRFHGNEPDWGFSSFIDWKLLVSMEEGYVSNDWMEIKVKVW